MQINCNNNNNLFVFLDGNNNIINNLFRRNELHFPVMVVSYSSLFLGSVENIIIKYVGTKKVQYLVLKTVH